MLPRSPDNASIVVVTEELENLNITREFTVSRERLDKALEWLILNNPLYRDVSNVSRTVITDASIFIRQHQDVEQNDEDEGRAYVPINNVSRIIRASYHQGIYPCYLPLSGEGST